MRRSQVTLFIIVGFVIILLFVFLFSFLHGYQEGRVSQQIIEGKSIERLTETYERYVESCTSTALKEGLYLIGQQGGVIYDTQADKGLRLRNPERGFSYGEHVLPRENEEDGVVYNVNYGIRRPETDEYRPPVPLYPYGEKRLVSDPAQVYDPSYTNVLGNNPPPGPFFSLCDSRGANVDGDYGVSCETHHPQQSTQSFLESFVERDTLECAQEGAFPGLDISYDILGVNATSIFSNNEVLVIMDMPVNITPVGRPTISPDVEPIEVRQNTRLKLIHELVYHLIDNDVNNIFFDIVRDANKVDTCRPWRGETTGCLKEGMKVSMIRNPCRDIDHIDCGHEENPEKDANFDNILVVTDENNYLHGGPYEFYVAIENRYPALDLIYQDEDLIGFEWDFIIEVGDELKIDPKGYDPDSDHHGEYGFMQEFYDYLHIGPDAHYHPTDIGEALMDSEIYEETRRKATYQPVESDIGNHTIRVRVCNQGELCDYQDVRIFVDALEPGESFNPYDDIDNEFASTEGPYTFSFPELPTPMSIGQYVYKILSSDEDELDRINTQHDYLQLPRDYLSYESGVELTKNMSDYFPEAGEYILEFEARDSSGNPIGDTQESDLTVKECLPHRSTEPPYPYTSEDFIFANHTCCIGDPGNPEEPDWGTFADDDRICFEDEQYGCYADFEAPYYGGDLDEPQQGDPDSDVYLFSFRRFCSGEEGMTCTGDIDIDFTLIDECDGPCLTCEEGGDGCVQADDGFLCNEDFECSSTDSFSGYNDPDGLHLCQGGCRSGDCVKPINCECSIDECSSECEGGFFRWSNDRFRRCNLNDCEWFSHYVVTDCMAYSSNENDYSETNVDVNGGVQAKMGYSLNRHMIDLYGGPGNIPNYILNEIDVSVEDAELIIDSTEDGNKYGSSCIGYRDEDLDSCEDNPGDCDLDDLNTWCYVSICDIDGCTDEKVDECLLPGNKGEENPERCYTEYPVCDLNGSCNSGGYELKPGDPDDCDEVDLECTSTGWECS